MNTFKFYPDATEYNGHNALSLGRAAKLSYASENEVKGTLKSWGFRNIHFMDKKGTQGFVAGTEQMILVAFRGTDIMRREDLKTDIGIQLVEGPKGRVHGGFSKALDFVWDEIKAKIEQFRQREQPVWFTGHSLGAGLATLAVAECVFGQKIMQHISVQGLYTFGSPRVGEVVFAEAFAEACKDCTFRFRNNNDFVCRVPVPGIFILRYRHVGNQRYFGANGDLRPIMGGAQLLADMIIGRFDDLGKPRSDGLRDHRIDRYLELLQKNVDVIVE